MPRVQDRNSGIWVKGLEGFSIFICALILISPFLIIKLIIIVLQKSCSGAILFCYMNPERYFSWITILRKEKIFIHPELSHTNEACRKALVIFVGINKHWDQVNIVYDIKIITLLAAPGMKNPVQATGPPFAFLLLHPHISPSPPPSHTHKHTHKTTICIQRASLRPIPFCPFTSTFTLVFL